VNRFLLAALAVFLTGAAEAQDIREAWLTAPTGRYGHGVFGDGGEYASLAVNTADGRTLAYTIPDGSVFEDLHPRLADFDGDGLTEAWTIRSDTADGARLEAYGVRNGRLVRVLAGPAIGLGFRWLNPVSFGDFDGDDALEAAYVETPHIGGILTVLEAGAGGRLEISARLHTYSNHAFRSRDLDLAAILDIDGDGADDIVLPTQPHDRIAVVSMIGGKLVERWRSDALPAIAGGLRAEKTEAGAIVRYRTKHGGAAWLLIPKAGMTPPR